LVRHLFNFALDRELVDSNPAARIKLLKEADRERVLTDAELVEVWNASRLLPSPLGALAKNLILTGQRRTECSGMAWTELDEAEALWVIPGERMKGKLIHEVPLAPAVIALLESLPAVGERKTYVFASTRRKDAPVSGFGVMKDELDWHILEARQKSDPTAKPMADWRLHDLRRTMRSGLSRLRIPSHIAERVIAHIPGGIQGVYDRFEYRDEKRQALEAWAAYVEALVDPKPKVTPIEEARQKRVREVKGMTAPGGTGQ
jgi:integrase